ncbi:MAG: ABC transporter ATP-binding protein [Methanocellales archaeon]|nr:ABC transporter ATP-binding protein [Methanocellales archaeon]
MSLMDVRGLYKGYDGRDVLKNINIKIEKGETLAVIGPTGSGKTTLLRLLNLLDNPDSGKVFFDGMDATKQPERIKLNIRRRMAMVFQKPVAFNASVYDNVAYGLKVRGRDEIEAKVISALKIVGLSGYEDRNAPTLSGGEMQRVALARAMIIEPEVLLLDEPTANLDPRSADIIEDLISRIRHERDTAIIMATHDMSQGQRLADRMGVLMEGELVQVGTPEEVFRKPESELVANFVGVENLFVGKAREKNGVTKVSTGNIELISSTKRTGEVFAIIRPEDIIVSKRKIMSSARNVLAGRIIDISNRGSIMRLVVNAGEQFVVFITRQSFLDMNLDIGSEVFLSFKAPSVHVFGRPR